jgi:hypothetical protein
MADGADKSQYLAVQAYKTRTGGVTDESEMDFFRLRPKFRFTQRQAGAHFGQSFPSGKAPFPYTLYLLPRLAVRMAVMSHQKAALRMRQRERTV